MKNTSIIEAIILLLLLSSIPAISSSYIFYSNNIIYVDDDGTADYTKIQDAVDNASDGDTIYVYSGIYYERLLINKSILLTGEGSDTTILHGYDTTGEEVTVAIFLYPVENVTISGFTIENSSFGIQALSMYHTRANNCTIEDIIFETGDDIGIDILLDGSTNMKIYNNIMNHGIYIYESFDNIIEDNEIHGKEWWASYLEQM